MRKVFLIVLVLTAVISACAPVTPVAPSDPSVVSTKCVRPESDNEYYWSDFSCVDVSTTAYRVTVKVTDEIVNHTEVGASGSGAMYYGFGSMSYRMWQEGKGLLPVEIIAINPAIEIFPVGSSIVLKTSDLKAMSLPSGSTTIFVCNLDTEVLSPVQSNQVLTTDRLTYELDDCRMTSAVYTP